MTDRRALRPEGLRHPELAGVGASAPGRDLLPPWRDGQVDHDDEVREYAYRSVSATDPTAEPIVETAARLGWTVVGMRDDWAPVFRDGIPS